MKKGFVGLSQILTEWLNGCIYGGNVWYSLKLDRYCAAAVRYDTQIPFHFHFYMLHSLFYFYFTDIVNPLNLNSSRRVCFVCCCYYWNIRILYFFENQFSMDIHTAVRSHMAKILSMISPISVAISAFPHIGFTHIKLFEAQILFIFLFLLNYFELSQNIIQYIHIISEFESASLPTIDCLI